MTILIAEVTAWSQILTIKAQYLITIAGVKIYIPVTQRMMMMRHTNTTKREIGCPNLDPRNSANSPPLI